MLSLPLILFILMYGFLLPLLLRVGHIILLFLWMIFPDILGFISSKNHFELYQIYRDFTKMIETQFSKPIKFSDLIMPKNIKSMNLPLFSINLVLSFIPLVLALLSKMAGLNANSVIFLMLFVLLLLPLLLLLGYGGKLLLLPFTPSIGVLLPLFRIKLLIICCLVLLPPITYLESLDVSILFFFKIMNETNFSLILVCVVFFGMELVKKSYRCYNPISKHLRVSRHVVFWEHKMFYQLPHVPVSPIPSINPLTDLFPEESLTSMSEHPNLVSESPSPIYDVPSHASDELLAPIIDVPTYTA